MTSEFAHNVINMLQREKRSVFGREALEMIKKQLFKEPEKALEKAFDRICLEMNTLPSAAKFLLIVQEEGKKIRTAEAIKREQEWNKEKGADGRGRVEGRTFLTKPQPTQHGRDALKIIHKILDGINVTEDCQRMAQMYPDQAEGWSSLSGGRE